MAVHKLSRSLAHLSSAISGGTLGDHPRGMLTGAIGGGPTASCVSALQRVSA